MGLGLVDARFAAYVAVAVVLIMTPGPDTALVTRNAIRGGWRAASYTTAGIAVGSAVWAAASVLGVAVLLERSVVAFTIFKLLGAAYLCFLGARSLLGGLRLGRRPRGLGKGDRDPEATVALARAPDAPRARLTGRAALRQGIANNLLNPKAGAIFATIFPQFILPGDSPLRLGLMLLAYETILLCWLNVYGALISRAGRSHAGLRVRALVERAAGAVLIALGVRLAFEQR